MGIKNFLRSLFFYFEKKSLTDHISTILNGQALALLDIGAAGDIETRWKRIDSLIEYIGFEPDERSYDVLKKSLQNCRKHEIHKTALWSSEGQIDFHFCKGWQQSSHFPPNYDLVDNFPQKDRFTVEQPDTLAALMVDNVVRANIDFVKIDTQGGELEILKGGTKTLANAFGLELELAIATIYSGQPMFQDLSDFLEKHGFIFVDFVSLRRWERHDINSSFGQLVFGDGLFIKIPEQLTLTYKNNYEAMRRYVAICCLYNRFDLIDVLLELAPKDFADDKLLSAVNSLKNRSDRFRALHKIANTTSKIFGSEFSMHGVL